MLFCLLFAGLTNCFPQAALAQEKSDQNEAEIRLWRFRVELIRDAIEKDSFALSGREQSLTYALASKSMPEYDLSRSRVMLAKSADLLVDSFADSSDRKEAAVSRATGEATKILRIIFEVDPALGTETSTKLFEKIRSDTSRSQLNADLLTALAILAAPNDAKAAHDLGLSSLRYGFGSGFERLIGEINLRSPELAESLFSTALLAARSRIDYTFIGGLAIAYGSYKGGQLSEHARRSFFVLLSSLMLEAATRPERRSEICKFMPLITPLAEQFRTAYPAEMALMQQNLAVCSPYLPQNTGEVAESQLDGKEPKTAEDFVSAARETRDRSIKTHYYYRAISLYGREKRFDKAVSLLDAISVEEREAIGYGSWDNWRAENAIRLAVTLFQNGDLPALHRTLDQTPANLRPYVRTSLAFELLQKSEPAFILDQLEAARRESASKVMKGRDAAAITLALLPVYANLSPTELTGLLRETVRYINAADAENPENHPERDFAPLQDSVNVPCTLLGIDDIGTLNSLGDIRKPASRMKIKLGLLQAAVKEYKRVAHPEPSN